MTFGINTFLFASPFTAAHTPLFAQFSKWGFDCVEIAVEEPDEFDAVYVRSQLDKYGLTCCGISAAMGPNRDLRGTSKQQEQGLTYLHSLLSLMPILSAPLIAGPLYSSVGRAEQTAPDDYKQQWVTVVNHLKELAKQAEQQGVRLAIEPLNRFETDFINTTQQALRLIGDVESPVLGLHLDTFHMNIEEKSLPAALKQAGPLLWHLHTCGSDRGTPGNDHTDWTGIASALTDINYQGSAVIESFTPNVKSIAKAAAIWRQIEPSPEDLARQGVHFLRKTLTGLNSL